MVGGKFFLRLVENEISGVAVYTKDALHFVPLLHGKL